ncbi:hypothetical protein BSL78_13608 [Apostichopus japonicus]|uniref:Uncharacterized protein n=1 Tax=Stichopus japonicus TaxID=307972 RepID=A0A2G8KNB7_STIJA|nr:hypothetical protein BSL78_13608 [Apostichopus japonicus]
MGKSATREAPTAIATLDLNQKPNIEANFSDVESGCWGPSERETAGLESRSSEQERKSHWSSIVDTSDKQSKSSTRAACPSLVADYGSTDDESGSDDGITEAPFLCYHQKELSDSGSECWDSDSDVRDPDYRYTGNQSESDSDESIVIPVFHFHPYSGKAKDCKSAEADTPSTSEAAEPTCSRTADHPSNVTGPSSSLMHESRKYSAPKRRCPFCDKYQTKLSRHIRAKHKDQAKVTEAIDAPKPDRLAMFNGFKKDGILKANKEEAKKVNPVYQKERAFRTGSGKIVMCRNCSGFFSRRSIGRHTKICCKESGKEKAFVPISLLEQLDSKDESFILDILAKLRDDEVGLMCRNDSVITTVGKRLWQQNKLKADKKTEVRKSVMTSMRRLSSLYLLFLKQREELGPIQQIDKNAADMFLRSNFNHLESAIAVYSTKGDRDSTDDLKHGLKAALYYLIKKAGKILKGTYLINDQDARADAVDKFMHVFEMNHNFIFGDASYAMQKNRNEKLRRPETLPLEEDVAAVRQYAIERMASIVEAPFLVFDSHAYIELRDLLVCRLTLFNARRGGEPCRLRLKEWSDADNNVWINQKDVEKLDKLDKAVANNLKVAYQTGKGNKHLVPILLPSDTIEPMRRDCT